MRQAMVPPDGSFHCSYYSANHGRNKSCCLHHEHSTSISTAPTICRWQSAREAFWRTASAFRKSIAGVHARREIYICRRACTRLPHQRAEDWRLTHAAIAKEIHVFSFPRRREAYCTVCEKFFTGDLVDHRRSAAHKVWRQRSNAEHFSPRSAWYLKGSLRSRLKTHSS